jgi:hypothetical protein
VHLLHILVGGGLIVVTGNEDNLKLGAVVFVVYFLRMKENESLA